ncbi:MAG TPA: hypothetical protein VH186_37760 [Chloroflexia bacterium]|nr:hypothetical protein [Chloroflexia bacterium]
MRRFRPQDLQIFSKFNFVLVLALLLSLFITLSIQKVTPASADAFASADFQQVWNRTDSLVKNGGTSRTYMWGPEPFTGAIQEDYAEAPGGRRLVQYFDKSRMEITHPDGDRNNAFYVTNGLIVREMMDGRLQLGDNKFENRPAAEIGVAGDIDDTGGPTYKALGRLTGATSNHSSATINATVDRQGNTGTAGNFANYHVTDAYFEASTGHNIASVFWNFLNQSGPVVNAGGGVSNGRLFEPQFYATGLPITEAYWARVKVAGVVKDVLVQAFERRILTFTPANPAAFQVEMGNVGRHYYLWRYSGASPVLGATGQLPPLPKGLKNTFMLGLANGPASVNWMLESGVKWDARYQYLSGGVNTGGGWATWNSPSGMFSRYYMEQSDQHGFLPVLSYYQLLQSKPASGKDEGEKDYNNLNNPSTMNAYYADFKLLMDRAHEFGKTVIVHVEPDLWSYMQRRSANPNSISASVASSGNPDLAGLPNTFAGFGKALTTLRDKYAPNVLLAYHVSAWGSTVGDLSTNIEGGFDTNRAATETANFYRQLGANFDLMFYDVADRDAAIYVSWGNKYAFWDLNNQKFPNFNRFHQFVATVTSITGKRGMLWQVPVGNTIYRTMNNTDGHYQDNRVQYYLNDSGNQHIQDAANSGLIGILFGGGNPGTTSYTDGKKDGVTNPAPINGNDKVAAYPDDDGGYLRLEGKAYYDRGPVSLVK